jgi:predicted acetyltransferase
MITDYREIKLETNYTLSEFFVMCKYRNIDVGTYVVKEIFKKFNGK